MQKIPDPLYCVRCGRALEERRLPDDSRPRKVCPACGFVHYVQPKIAAGVLVEHEGGLVLVRRGVEPRKGFWSFPCGFMEVDETVEEAARRETLEESGLEVEITGHLGTYSYVQTWHGGGVVVVAYMGRAVGGEARPGDDATELRIVRPPDIPWGDLAFESSHAAFRDWMKRRL